MGRGGPGRRRRSLDSRLGLNDLRAVTQSVSNAYALPHANNNEQKQHPQPPPYQLSRGPPSLAAAAIAQRTQYYRPPKDIGYHEITPSLAKPCEGLAALYILMLEPSVATSNRRCTTFMILDSPFQENCFNMHISCNQENGQWRTRTEPRRQGTPRTETQSLLTLDFVSFIDPFRRDHLQNLLLQQPPPATQNNEHYTSQSWAHESLMRLHQYGIIGPNDFIRAQRNIITSMAIPFFSLKPNIDSSLTHGRAEGSWDSRTVKR